MNPLQLVAPCILLCSVSAGSAGCEARPASSPAPTPAPARIALALDVDPGPEGLVSQDHAIGDLLAYANGDASKRDAIVQDIREIIVASVGLADDWKNGLKRVTHTQGEELTVVATAEDQDVIERVLDGLRG